MLTGPQEARVVHSLLPTESNNDIDKRTRIIMCLGFTVSDARGKLQ